MLYNNVFLLVFYLKEQPHRVKMFLEVYRRIDFLMKCCIDVFVKF